MVAGVAGSHGALYSKEKEQEGAGKNAEISGRIQDKGGP